jgi:hypothetical protein
MILKKDIWQQAVKGITHRVKYSTKVFPVLLYNRKELNCFLEGA